MTPELALAAWGAAISTVLLVRAVLAWIKERPKLRVDLRVQYEPLGDDAEGDDPRILRMTDERGMPQGASLWIGAANVGSQAIQVVSVFFEGPRFEQQVIPEQLPVVLEPNTRVDLTLQPEWATPSSEVIAIGVLDALGKKHHVTTDELRATLDQVEALPVRARMYKRRDPADEQLPETVTAFQAFDRAMLVRRPDRRA